MIKSMTGYGRENFSKDLREYQVEIRSVNHRYLDISVRIPKIISYLEDSIKKEVAKYIKRGKIEIYINFENNSSEGNIVKINKEIAKVYIKELKELAESEGICNEIQVTEISKFPDVLKIENEIDEGLIKQELIDTVSKALISLVGMRKLEGKQIFNDITDRISNIENKISKINQYSTRLISEYVVKLENRIKELINNKEIDKVRLEQEIIIYADKCSVEEEITRLNSHVHQLEKLLNSEDSVGKKLDFLIQEMNRETNTIGSKANNLEITKNVIDIKTELENIREQIQNVE